MRGKKAKLGWEKVKILVKVYLPIFETNFKVRCKKTLSVFLTAGRPINVYFNPFSSQFSLPIPHRFPTLYDQFSDLFQAIFRLFLL